MSTNWIEFISKYLDLGKVCFNDGLLNIRGERIEKLLQGSGMTLAQARDDAAEFFPDLPKSLALYARAERYAAHLQARQKVDADAVGPTLNPGYFIHYSRKRGPMVMAVYCSEEAGVVGHYISTAGPFKRVYTMFFPRRTDKYTKGCATTADLHSATDKDIERWKAARDRFAPRLRGPDEPPSEEEKARLRDIMRRVGSPVVVLRNGKVAKEEPVPAEFSPDVDDEIPF